MVSSARRNASEHKHALANYSVAKTDRDVTCEGSVRGGFWENLEH